MSEYRRGEEQALTITTPTTSAAPPALSTPATAEELARAAAALEHRNPQNAQPSMPEGVDGAVTEGDILAEVARQRETAYLDRAAIQKRRQRRTRKARITLLTAIPLLAGGLYAASYVEGRMQQDKLEMAAESGKNREVAPVSWSLPGDTLTLSRSPAGDRLRPLADVPDGETIEVAAQDFYAGKRLSAAEIMARAKGGQTWRVVKHNGRPYLRAYLPAPMSAAVVLEGNLWIANTPRPGIRVSQKPFHPDTQSFGEEETVFTAEKPTPITLPLDGLKFLSAPFSGGSLPNKGYLYEPVARPVPTDSHLFETWGAGH